jgi:hypothetical protein
VIYAYSIGDPAADAPSDRRGLGGAVLRTLESAGLAAVYSRHRALRPRPSPELVLVHERVVEAVMARGAALPLRFGTVLDREDQLAAAVDERKDELRRALERVRGHVELGVRVMRPDAPGSDPRSGDAGGDVDGTSGRAYLLARAAEHHRADQAAGEIHRPLAELAAASTVRERPRPPAVMVAAYLVDAGRIDDFRTRAEELAARHDDLKLVVTGPWPPYNFATEEGA